MAFESPLNAVRFCHVAQVALMFNRWPHDSAVLCGPEEYNVEGRLIFAGPRVAMALHTSHDFTSALHRMHHLRNVDHDASHLLWTRTASDCNSQKCGMNQAFIGIACRC